MSKIILFFNKVIQSRQKTFLFVSFFYILSHVFFLNLPPQGAHVWRQCNTSAVARNFVEEDMNVFCPRVDSRGDTEGVTGMQFPSFEISVALISKALGGYHESINRIVSFLFFGLGLYFFYELLVFLSNSKRIGFFGVWAFMWSPVLYYHSTNALPDILALSASIGGLLYFLKWNTLRSNKYIFLALFFTTLAGLTKLQYLSFGALVLVTVIQGLMSKSYSIKEMIMIFLYGGISFFTSVAWYVYADYLIETSGLHDFGLILRPLTDVKEIVTIVLTNLFVDLPEYILGFTSVVPFVFGFVYLVKSRLRQSSLFIGFLVWVLGLIVYYILELEEMKSHTYYLFPTFIILFMLVAVGLNSLWDKYTKWMMLLMVLMPFLAFARVHHHWLSGGSNLPSEFTAKESRTKIDNLIPKGSITIVGIDGSRCVYHYYAHTKGFSFTRKGELLEVITNENGKSKIRIESYINRGAEYLIVDNKEIEDFPELWIYLSEEKYIGKTLRLFKLKNPL